jgi:hypothetical protein
MLSNSNLHLKGQERYRRWRYSNSNFNFTLEAVADILLVNKESRSIIDEVGVQGQFTNYPGCRPRCRKGRTTCHPID